MKNESIEWKNYLISAELSEASATFQAQYPGKKNGWFYPHAEDYAIK